MKKESQIRLDSCRTKEGLIKKIYKAQKSRCKIKGRNLPTYSVDELKEWLYSQPEFHILYDNWKRLDYQTMAIPSCDRIKNNISYTLANIQIVTWKTNLDNANQDVLKGKLKRRHKPVQQFTLDGEFIAEYESAVKASETTGSNLRNIGKVCCGERKTTGGFIWKFKTN